MVPLTTRIMALLVAAATAAAGCIGAGGVPQSDGGNGSANAAVDPNAPGEIEPAPGHISGIVVDPELVPVAEAYVAVTPGDYVTTTNAAGAFKIGPLAEGTYSVLAEKRGYQSATIEVAVREESPTKVTLTLEPMASDVPYHETLTRVMFLYCAVAIAPPTTLRAPCGGLVDIVLQTVTGQPSPNTLDTWTFDFRIEKPGFASLVMEMVWPPQSLGQNALMQLTKIARAQSSGGGVTISGTVYGGHMAQPYHDVIHAGRLYVSNRNNTFYPTPNATQDFQMLVSVYEGNTTTGHGVFIQWRPTVYLTFFYNRQASPDFTILPDR